MSIVCVLGATGIQGGSVCQALLKNPRWKVRGLTRNTNSDSAKQLSAQGVEVVSADAGDETSLVKAFEGAVAIFALTNYNWETVQKLGRDVAGEDEKQQHLNIARAAAKTSTLEHYIMSTLPPASKMSGGKLKVPHFDYKHAAYEWIEANLPSLMPKITRLWLGWYPTNLVYFPMMKFIPVPGSGTYLFAQPSKPDAMLPIAGDVSYNTGVMVEGILGAGPRSHGKLAVLVTDYLNFTDVVELWGKITGKQGVYVELSDEAYTKLWGIGGEEVAAQFRWSEQYPNWEQIFPDQVISFEELGVKDKLIGVERVLYTMRDSLI